MKLQDVDVNALNPRVHGNGFIQADLDQEHRLHVWGHPDIPRQKVNSPIHDHIFGFESIVHVGRLVNVTWNVIFSPDRGAFRVYEAQPPVDGSHDSKLATVDDHAYDVWHMETEVIMPGQWYIMEPGVFHETFAPEPTLTIIKKDGKTIRDNPGSETKPRVLIPVGKYPDNEFDRHAFDRDFLLGIIKEVMES